jgi:hypothetical protein
VGLIYKNDADSKSIQYLKILRRRTTLTLYQVLPQN